MKNIFLSFGKNFFNKEFATKEKELIELFISTRNKLFHIDKSKKALTGNECVMYIQKLILLIRHIVLNLLGIDEKLYIGKISEQIDSINNHDNILNDLISKI